MRRGTLIAVVVLALLAPPTVEAIDAPVPALVDACGELVGPVPEVGGRSCRSVEQVGRSSAQVCRHASLGDELCGILDGRSVTAASIDRFEASRTARALAHQRALGATVPLRLGVLAHTHNSYNSAAYPLSVSRLDHNQVHSMTDQLRMGIRALEIDVHWAPNVSTLSLAPTTCHGQVVATPVATLHVGCSTEGTLHEALSEVDRWLRAHPGEMVLIDLENGLDGEPEAHAAAVEAIEATIGDLVLRPTEPCGELPVDRSPADVLAEGKQVLLTGACGPGAWGTWVHPQGPRWSQGTSGPGRDYPPAPECADRAGRDYDDGVIRFWGDSTWLTHMVNGEGSEVVAAEVRDMVACGVNLIGFDQLAPDDGRLEALVWSWAPAEPAVEAGCAARGPEGWFAADCSVPHRFACDTGSGWAVAPASGAWSDGDAACAAIGATFAVPRTGRADALLGIESGSDQVWLAYRHDGTDWSPTAP